MQGFAIPTNYMSVLRDTDRTLPLHESFQQRIAVDQGMLFFAQSQVLQAWQGPQFYFFSRPPWTRPLPDQATRSEFQFKAYLIPRSSRSVNIWLHIKLSSEAW